MSFCRVSSCFNKKERDGVKFFTFPRDPTICEQWIEFCCCAQTAEVFYTGGVFALKSYAICADHFEAAAFVTTAPFGSRLVEGAVPSLKPGRTLPVVSGAKPAIAREPLMGDAGVSGEVEEEVVLKQEDGGMEFEDVPTEDSTAVAVEQVFVKQEDEEVAALEFEIVEPLKEEEEEEEKVLVLDPTQVPDEVLVEMLDPEEIKEENLPEFEEIEPIVLEEIPSREFEIIELEDEVESTRAQHQKGCFFATGKISNFEERYKRQILQNKNTERQIEIETSNYSQMVEKYEKTNDLLARKRRKKQQLQRKLQEYKRRGPEALLKSFESSNAQSCDDDSDSSMDETKAWW